MAALPNRLLYARCGKSVEKGDITDYCLGEVAKSVMSPFFRTETRNAYEAHQRKKKLNNGRRFASEP